MDRSVSGSMEGSRRAAVCFSGGLDSSVLAICAKGHGNPFAVSVFTEGSHDSRKARAAASLIGIELVQKVLDRESIVKESSSMELPFEPSPMDRSLWCLYRTAAKEAASRGGDLLILGQLADELFGGYAKYARALSEDGQSAAASMMSRDVEDYPKRGRIRDVSAISPWVRPSFPYEADGVRKLANAFPMEFKISGTTRKAVLRKAALVLGLPEELAASGKKAAQYSSGVGALLKSA